MTSIYNFFQTVPILMILGITIVLAYYFGQFSKKIKLPTVIGFMILGVIMGPSLLNILTDDLQVQLGFITDIALGFVALSIGLELKFTSLKKLGSSIVWIILAESFGAFILVTVAMYFLTGNLPLSLIFGAIAPASAPAGTVAVIQEYKTNGPMTKALYAVVGFDDGLGVIIFGFAAAIAKHLLEQQTGMISTSFWAMIWPPFLEIILSIVIGTAMAFLFSVIAKRMKNTSDVSVILIGMTFVAVGLCNAFGLSLILTIMIMGLVIVNTQSYDLTQRISDSLPALMPLLFILFFTLAGANLHIQAMASLGLIGLVYFFTRSAGLILGAQLGASIGHTSKAIKNWIGWGILSQAGVAIGLSLIVKKDFAGLGAVLSSGQTNGDYIGITVITTVTVTSIIFGIIGPFFTKLALQKAGEI